MTSLFFKINFNELLVAIISAFLTWLFSWKILKHQEKNVYAKERYEYVIFPIFEMIEPHLYPKKINDEIIEIFKKICTVVKQNRKYINGLILENVDFCNRELESTGKISKKSFSILCSIISIEYDKSCKQLGIGKRTFAYKWNNQQIRPDKATFFYQTLKILTLGLGLCTILLFTSFIINILYGIISLILHFI